MRSPQIGEIVDVFDLDHTLLNTESLWFNPALDRLAECVPLSRAVVDARFAECNQTTFTFAGLLERLGIEPSRRNDLERELRDDLSARIEACLYPGVIEMLKARNHVARLALVTAGDADWQQWKFARLRALHPFFRENDRHFVPLRGSKADCFARYATASRISFIDDSPRWHHEVAAAVRNVRHVRAMWPDTLGVSDHPGDGRDWDVACSAKEMLTILSVA